MNHLKFGVYKHHIVCNDGTLLRKQLIVLYDEAGDIIGWTDFHRYARGGKKALSRSIDAGQDKRCVYAAMLLNYVFFQRYHIKRLTDIEAVMVKDFLQDYSLCRLPDDGADTHRAENTVNLCISAVIDFLDLVIADHPSCKMKVSDLYRTEKVFVRKSRRYVEKKVPVFEINYRPSNRAIFRDIPEGAFQIIMDEIARNHRNILMLTACSAFAGLRPSECCNVRRADSALGPGLYFEVIDGEVTNVTIDLRTEFNLRSDLVSVGGIKKPRKQKVYHAFLKAFVDCYNTYMKYIEGKPYESAYGALTNTSVGKAYTYPAYRAAFQKAVKACIPTMLASNDPQIVNYGHLLLENHINPHILRHWFSVKLTLYGEDVAGLMYWRGDTSPESALPYITGKSELEKQYKLVNNEAFDYLLWRAGKIEEEKHD